MLKFSSSRSAMAIQAMKLLLLLTGLVSVCMMARTALCSSSSSLFHLWTSMKRCVSSPLCICIIINSIIALIAASSTHQVEGVVDVDVDVDPFLFDNNVEDINEKDANDHHQEQQVSVVETMDDAWELIASKKELTTPTTRACDSGVILKKSETVAKSGMRREASIGLEELNKQIEAFINKFNDEMKLQRQESDKRFMDMINRSQDSTSE